MFLMFSIVQSSFLYFDLHMKIFLSSSPTPHTRSARNPSARDCLLIYRIRHVGVIITSCCFFASGFPYWENLKRSSFHQFAAPSLVSAKIIISVFTFSPFQNSVSCRGCGAVLYQIISFRGFAFCAWFEYSSRLQPFKMSSYISEAYPDIITGPLCFKSVSNNST